MSKWRPTKDSCIYVIPDIHGSLEQLNLILSRILPLRKKDKIVLLGDYIDRGALSHEVLDLVIRLKKQYPNQVITLKGNHEDMFLCGLGYKFYKNPDNMFDMWLYHGGRDTLIGYLFRAGKEDLLINGHCPNLSKNEIKRLVPKEHVSFLLSLDDYFETEDFIFVHGGCDPTKPLKEQSTDLFCWDRSMYREAKLYKTNGVPYELWDKVVVAGHNGLKEKEPFIYGNYIMLDAGGKRSIFVAEVNSMECFVAKRCKKRLVKHELKYG